MVNNCLHGTFTFVAILALIHSSYAANIIILCPPAFTLMIGPANVGKMLVDQGHNVTMAVPPLLKSKAASTGLKLLIYNSLEGLNMLKVIDNIVVDGFERGKSDWSLYSGIAAIIQVASDKMLKDERLLEDFRAHKPDLMILSSVPPARMLTIIPYKLDVPFVFISTMAPAQFIRNPILPSVIPNQFLDFSDQMTFPQRTANTFLELISYYYNPINYLAAVHLYAPEKPYISLHDLQAKALLWIVNQHPVLDYSPPSLPNVKHIGPLIELQPKPLPQELQEFMDSAKEGVVIVSFGSILEAPFRKSRDKFLKAFQETKYKYIIRYSSPDLASSEKILFAEWIPQYDLLHHKNTRLLITHCGFKSIHEAVYAGVPMIAFPVTNDQPHNAAMIARKGFGLRLEIRTFAVQKLASAINEVIINPTFKAQTQKASNIMQADRVAPTKEAAYWINHVLTFGADHLRSSAQDIPMWKYLGLDVMAVFIVVWHIFLFIFIKIVYLLCYCCRRKEKTTKTE